MWHVAEYTIPVDDTAGISEAPATASRYTGSAFKQQDVTGTRLVDSTNDRVTYEASILSPSPQAYSIGLGDDVAGTGYQSVYGGLTFGGIAYGNPADTGPDDGRPRVGFPLSHEPDDVYANRTGDMAGDTIGEPFPQTIGSDVYLVPEAPKDLPSRGPTHPAEIQHERPWDIIMGSWPWTGEKVALQRPEATVPMTFDHPLTNAIPSPTGTSGADLESQYNVYPNPLTFRLPPQPWDTANDGAYVDSGN